jgi:stearoyl-CoA desaturase (delta-9 desaturase)
MLFGLLNLSWWGDIIALLIMTHITIASVTIYLHRCQSHKGLALHPIISHFFRFWLWLTTGMVTKEWVAIHRKHHDKCETAGDPHSPRIYGLGTVMWRGTELYRAESKNLETIQRYGRGTPNDWVERNVYSRFSWLGISLMAVIDLVLFGLPGISIWGTQMVWMPFFGAGFINAVGHAWGYRNFETPEAARNIVPWGIIIGGEELHNNHHTFPSSAKMSVKWYEFDLGWFYISNLQRLGLAKVFKVPPKLHSVLGKTTFDNETIAAIVSNNLQIMSRYSREVIVPVLRIERKRAGEAGRRLFNQAKTLLVRESSLVDESGKKRLSQLLEKYQVLQQVYHYRLHLQAIWSRSTATQKELLEALQEWCRQAEATGIESLHQFSQRLKSYAIGS